MFWRTLLDVAPIESSDKDPRSSIRFDARDAFRLFLGVIVSGMPFRDSDSVLDRMVEVLRPVFPESEDVLGEDLCDPERVSLDVLESLDACSGVRGMATQYLTLATLHFVTYPYSRLYSALCATADLSPDTASGR